MKFRDWNEYYEMFNGLQPNAAKSKWSPPLAPSNSSGEFSYHYYSFDVSTERCGGQPCYTVFAKMSDNVADIGFSHSDTGVSDRFNFNKNNDSPYATGVEVLREVLNALSQYISIVKPPALKWSGVMKKDGSKNVDARDKIYDMWANRFLSKEYTKTQNGIWIRNDSLHQFAPKDPYDPYGYGNY